MAGWGDIQCRQKVTGLWFQDKLGAEVRGSLSQHGAPCGSGDQRGSDLCPLFWEGVRLPGVDRPGPLENRPGSAGELQPLGALAQTY